MIYGYARVSTKDQNEIRQIIALREHGVDQIIVDKESGKDFDRPGYRRLLRKLKPGDTLAFKSIDRLGRSYDEILEEWRRLVKEKHVAIVVLDMPLLNTRTDDDLIGRLLSDIILQLLSYVAQTEREFIRQRQAEGIAAAKARGVHLGRKYMQKPDGFQEAKERYARGEITIREGGQLCGVSHSTFRRWCLKSDEAAEDPSLRSG